MEKQKHIVGTKSIDLASSLLTIQACVKLLMNKGFK